MSLLQESELKARLQSLMLIRFLFVSVILAAGVLVLEFDTILSYRLVVASYYVSILSFAVLYKKNKNYNTQAYAQVIVDVVLCNAIVYWSGSLDSRFIFVPIVPILLASTLLSAVGVYFLTLLTCILYALQVFAELFIFKPELFVDSDNYYLLYSVYARISVFGIAGYLTGCLAARLRAGERELSKLRRLTDIVLKQMSSGMIITDKDDSVIYINDAGSQVLGISSENITGTKWFKYFLGEKDLSEDVINMYRTKRDFETTIKKEGEEIPVGFNITDIKDEIKSSNEEIVGKVLVFKDLSEIKQLEYKMRQADKLSAIGSLAAGIAHEIRNPLSAISGAVEVLKENASFAEEEQKELVEVVLTETERLNGIIKEFLNYTKVRPIEISTFDANRIFYEIINLVRKGNILKDNISLMYKNKDRKFVIEADVDQVKQVFFNLVLNSIDAMSEKGGMLTIELDEDDNTFTAVISDTGCGIKPARIDKIFEPFYSSKDKGVGIGLSIVSKIIESHKGEITVKSKLEEGTAFTVKLPKKQDRLGNLKQKIDEI